MTPREIIRHERFLINGFRRRIESGTSSCVACDESAIEYHEQIIEYLIRLLELEEREK